MEAATIKRGSRDKVPAPIYPEKHRIELADEVADFLARELAEKAFLDLKAEGKEDIPSLFEVRQMHMQFHRKWEVIELLTEEREVVLSARLLSFVGERLGRWEAVELEGWTYDEEDYAERRRLARATWAAFLEALSKLDFSEEVS